MSYRVTDANGAAQYAVSGTVSEVETAMELSKAPYTFLITATDPAGNTAQCGFQVTVNLNSSSVHVNYDMIQPHQLVSIVKRDSLEEVYSKAMLHVNASGNTSAILPPLLSQGGSYNHIRLTLNTQQGDALRVTPGTDGSELVYLEADVIFAADSVTSQLSFDSVDTGAFARLSLINESGSSLELTVIPSTLYLHSDILIVQIRSQPLDREFHFTKVQVDIFMPSLVALDDMEMDESSSIVFVKHIIGTSGKTTDSQLTFFSFLDVEPPAFNSSICGTSTVIATQPGQSTGVYVEAFPAYTDNYNDADSDLQVNGSSVMIAAQVQLHLELASTPWEVAFLARDGADNVGTCIVMVQVEDIEVPTADCPSSVSVYVLKFNESSVVVVDP
jgi:hypothetical protein